MILKKDKAILLIFNLIYIIGFSIYYISTKNYEFTLYIIIMIALLSLISFTQRFTKFSNFILWCLTGWGILHMAGGIKIINGEVLYALRLIPLWTTDKFYVLKYDQFMHGYLYFVIVFVIWHILKPNLNNKVNNKIIYPFIVLASTGIGAFNEILEFIAVLAFKDTEVGGYYNTAWDIVFNTVGAILAAIILHFLRKKRNTI